MFLTGIRDGKAFAPEQKIRELKKKIKFGLNSLEKKNYQKKKKCYNHSR